MAVKVQFENTLAIDVATATLPVTVTLDLASHTSGVLYLAFEDIVAPVTGATVVVYEVDLLTGNQFEVASFNGSSTAPQRILLALPGKQYVTSVTPNTLTLAGSITVTANLVASV